MIIILEKSCLLFFWDNLFSGSPLKELLLAGEDEDSAKVAQKLLTHRFQEAEQWGTRSKLPSKAVLSESVLGGEALQLAWLILDWEAIGAKVAPRWEKFKAIAHKAIEERDEELAA